MKTKRPYRMGARALAAEETGRRVIRAALEMFGEGPFEDITLDAVAGRAGVTLQSVLRKFGSKAGLIAAAATQGAEQVMSQRDQAPVGDVHGAIANLFDHYEEWGDVALRTVAQEERYEEIAEIARNGRALHAAWVERVFEPELKRRRGNARAMRRAQLVAICDVTMWKLLRREMKWSDTQAMAYFARVARALLAS